MFAVQYCFIIKQYEDEMMIGIRYYLQYNFTKYETDTENFVQSQGLANV